MEDVSDGPSLCPRYDEFRFIDDQGRERVQYCPVSGFFISGSCSREERRYASKDWRHRPAMVEVRARRGMRS